MIVLSLFALITDAQQVWKPRDTTTTRVQVRIIKVQCWGTTKDNKRCKRIIDSSKPGKAVMDAGGVYYCAQHAYQIGR